VAGRRDDGVADRVDRVEPRRQLGAQLARHVGAKQLALPVRREAERQELQRGEHVRWAPGVEADAQYLELDRQRARIRRRRVDAGAQRVELGAQPRLQRSGLALRDAPQAEGSHEPVRRKPLLARYLRDPARGAPAVQLHLPETILAVAVALREPEVLDRPRPYVRHAPPVSPDVDRRGDALGAAATLVVGQRAAEELVMQRRRRRGAERGDAGHARRRPARRLRSVVREGHAITERPPAGHE
jgi:hypothetical protein